jgi:hypothetical protein
MGQITMYVELTRHAEKRVCETPHTGMGGGKNTRHLIFMISRMIPTYRGEYEHPLKQYAVQ